jgi:hypothetical protein
MPNQTRVVVALPDSLECAAVSDWLAAEGLEPVVRPTVQTAADEMHSKSFDLLLADETFVFRSGLRAGGRIRNGRVPTVVIGGAPDAPASDAFSAQVMYLSRPVDRTLLVCYVSMAILDGRPVRRSMRKPVARFDAFVNGLPVRLVDVSNEGMRIEMPPGRLAPLTAVFNIRIPFVGVSVTAQRMWGRTASAGSATASYGAALAQNRPTAERAWRLFVDTIPAPSGSELAKA